MTTSREQDAPAYRAYCDGGGNMTYREWRTAQTYRSNNSPTPMTHRVFVYGTLKRGFWNNRLLIGSHFTGEATTPAMFRMIEPSFPVILEQAGGRPVAGELWHVDDETLDRLDRLEGVRPDGEGMYIRKVVDVVEAGHKVSAHIYVGHPIRWGNPNNSIPSYNKVNAAGALDWRP